MHGVEGGRHATSVNPICINVNDSMSLVSRYRYEGRSTSYDTSILRFLYWPEGLWGPIQILCLLSYRYLSISTFCLTNSVRVHLTNTYGIKLPYRYFFFCTYPVHPCPLEQVPYRYPYSLRWFRFNVPVTFILKGAQAWDIRLQGFSTNQTCMCWWSRN
jgi:hypothetical protein